MAELIGPIAIQHGQALIQATQDGLALPKSQLPDPLRIKESPFETENMASLWSTIEAMANTHHIDPMMICSRAELSETLRRLACGVMPTSSKLFTGWRGKLLGPIIHQALTALPPKPPTSET